MFRLDLTPGRGKGIVVAVISRMSKEFLSDAGRSRGLELK